MKDWEAIKTKALEDVAKTRSHTLYINGLERADLQVCVQAAIEKYGKLPELVALEAKLDELTESYERTWGDD